MAPGEPRVKQRVKNRELKMKQRKDRERYFRSSLPNMASDGLKYQVCSRNAVENEDEDVVKMIWSSASGER